MAEEIGALKGVLSRLSLAELQELDREMAKQQREATRDPTRNVQGGRVGTAHDSTVQWLAAIALRRMIDEEGKTVAQVAARAGVTRERIRVLYGKLVGSRDLPMDTPPKRGKARTRANAGKR